MSLEEMTLDWKILDNKFNLTELDAKKKSLNLGSQDKDKPKFDKDKEQAKVSGEKEKESENPIDKIISKAHQEKKEKERKSTGNFKVLIAAAPNKIVRRYLNIFQAAGLELLSLETENFALERSLVGGDKTPVMIVDIGSISSDITVVENGVPLLSRSVDTGGAGITKTIVNSMHVDQKRAEQFKRDIGFSSGHGNLPKVIESAITPVINEIKYCFDLYASSESQQRIEKIILTGGSAFLPNVTEYLSQLLSIKVFVGDPWARTIFPVELKPVLDELAPRFSVAVGLAMREIV